MIGEILVYAKYDENNSIVAIRSNIFLGDTDGWTQIDEWQDDQDRYMYAHVDNGEYVQEKYGKPLYDDSGRPNFHGDFVEWTEEEKEEKYPLPDPMPSGDDNMTKKIKTTLNEMVLNALPDGETLTKENAPTLVDIINPATLEESGTQTNPIVIVDNDIAHNGYLYTYGKYYKWNNTVYLCKRQGESDGGTIKLFYTPDQLIGHYFTLV